MFFIWLFFHCKLERDFSHEETKSLQLKSTPPPVTLPGPEPKRNNGQGSNEKRARDQLPCDKGSVVPPQSALFAIRSGITRRKNWDGQNQDI